MANIAGVQQGIPLVKNSYKSLLSLGEGAKADDFRMTIEGYPDLEYLVQAVQFSSPGKREAVESRGPHGIQFVQMGTPVNASEMPITFKEVISGKAYEALRDWVKNKKYLDITLALISESNPDGAESLTNTYEDCWIEMDGVDLSVEDGAQLVKPAGTIRRH